MNSTRSPVAHPLAERLIEVAQKDFYDIVDRDVRGAASSEEAAALRSGPHVVERWHSTLTTMKRRVEGTLAAKKSEMKADRFDAMTRDDQPKAEEMTAKYHRWRTGAVRFSTGVAEKLTEAKELRAKFFPDRLDSAAILERNLLSRKLDMLMMAIETHRDATTAMREPTEADEKLWSQTLH